MYRNCFNSPITFFLILLVGLFSLTQSPSVARAEEAEEPARTIYIPYEELEKVFAKKGEGVFLPWAEFQRLWNAAQKGAPVPIKPVKPPVPYAITAGSYVGVAKDKVVTFEVTYDVEVFGEQWSQVPLPLMGVAITEKWKIAGPDAEKATIITGNPGYTLLAPAKGKYTVTLHFVAPVSTAPGKRAFTFHCPKSPVSRLELRIPDPEAKVAVQPNLAVSSTVEDDTTRVLAFVGATNMVNVQWEPKPVEDVVREAVYFAERYDRFGLEEGQLRIDAAFRLAIPQGKLDKIHVRIPEGLQLVSLPTEHIKGWEQGPAQIGGVDYPHVLTLNLVEPLGQGYNFNIGGVLDMAEELDALTLPDIFVIGAERETGFITITNHARLLIKLKSKSGVAQVSPKEVTPQAGRFSFQPSHPPVFAFKYFKHPTAITLGLERVHAKITATNGYLVWADVDKLVIHQSLALNVQKVGTFRFRVLVPAGVQFKEITNNRAAIDGNPVVKAVENGSEITFVTRQKITHTDPQQTFNIQVRYEAPFGLEDAEPAFDLPILRVADVHREKGYIGVGSAPALRLMAQEDSIAGLEPAAVNRGRIPQSAPGATFAYVYDLLETTQQRPAGRIGVTQKSSRTTAQVATSVTVTKNQYMLFSTLSYTTQFAPAREFFFAVPAEIPEESVEIKVDSDAFVTKISEEGGYRVHKVTKQTPLLGTTRVTVAYTHRFEEAGLEQGLTVSVPDVKAHTVYHQTRHLAVQKDPHVEVDIQDAEGLEQIDVTELSSISSLAGKKTDLAFRYTAHDKPSTLTLGARRYQYEKPSELLITGVRAVTTVSNDTSARTQVTYQLKNKTHQYLPIALPSGAKLLELKVNGQEGQAVKGDGPVTHQIKLPPGQTDVVTIVLTYQHSLSDTDEMPAFGTLEAALPNLRGLPASEAVWELYLPQPMHYYDVAGNFKVQAGESDLSGAAQRAYVGLFGTFVDLSTGTKAAADKTGGAEESYRKLTVTRTLGGDGSAMISFASPDVLLIFFLVGFILFAAIGFALTRFGKSHWVAYALTVGLAAVAMAAMAPLTLFAAAAGAFDAAAIVALVGLARWLITGLLAEAMGLAEKRRPTPAADVSVGGLDDE